MPYSIHYGQLSVAVAFLLNGTPDVQLKIQVRRRPTVALNLRQFMFLLLQISTCECKARWPEFFTMLLQGTYDTRQQVFKREILFSDLEETNQITLTLPKTLIPNELYTIAVIPGNSAGNSAFNIGSIHFCK